MTIFLAHCYRFTTLRSNEGNNESKYGHRKHKWCCFMAVATQETIEVMVATTSPLMQDRELASFTTVLNMG